MPLHSSRAGAYAHRASVRPTCPEPSSGALRRAVVSLTRQAARAYALAYSRTTCTQEPKLGVQGRAAMPLHGGRAGAKLTARPCGRRAGAKLRAHRHPTPAPAYVNVFFVIKKGKKRCRARASAPLRPPAGGRARGRAAAQQASAQNKTSRGTHRAGHAACRR